MSEQVYIVHRNVRYEFGEIVGVFVSLGAAIARAKTLDQDGEIEVTRWHASDDPAEQKPSDVWRVYLGKLDRIELS